MHPRFGQAAEWPAPEFPELFDGKPDLPRPWLDLKSEWAGCVLLAGPVGPYWAGYEPTTGELMSMIDRWHMPERWPEDYSHRSAVRRGDHSQQMTSALARFRGLV
jgi:hypothetical protein